MYSLYIKVENGQTIDHPVYAWNLLEFYPSIPDNYQPFVRADVPDIGVYQVRTVDPNYGLINGIWTDIWTVRDMTPEEKQSKIDAVMALPHPDGWVFDETNCKWINSKLNINASGGPPNVIR